ncbi:DUF2635 domain-containing protein [Paraburkholderia bryophila]|uniref:DUF2635 domain-containing protein n=1 Tax=Paraburkholderia bryophila TaxID=420952 RepID=A0A7Y9WIB8_9BURK|nr:DUF2635 domain-containing protein [Paraburkholderia bryophila]NYH21387.1 hypothetical protein [Paraburkholderia bryophila]
MRIKPAPGLSVRDPETKQLLPADGIDVPDDSILWTKILNDGDVVLVTAKSAPAREGEKA